VYRIGFNIMLTIMFINSQQRSILFYFNFISFIGHRNSRLQGERPMGLVQTGKRDPCKAQPRNKSMTR
jgi:hypothetical protein